METINKNIDGKKFQITQFKALEALKIEKKVMAIAMPVIAPLLDSATNKNKKTKGKSIIDADIDFSKVADGFVSSLGRMPDDDYVTFITQVLSKTMCLDVTPPEYLNTEDSIDRAFSGSLITVYKLIWEVLKVNKMSFFELMDGSGMKVIDSSGK